jgi:hypothetical protein
MPTADLSPGRTKVTGARLSTATRAVAVVPAEIGNVGPRDVVQT